MSDVTLTISSADLNKLLTGKLTLKKAYEQGRIKVRASKIDKMKLKAALKLANV